MPSNFSRGSPELKTFFVPSLRMVCLDLRFKKVIFKYLEKIVVWTLKSQVSF
jgi:hypothetical protein